MPMSFAFEPASITPWSTSAPRPHGRDFVYIVNEVGAFSAAPTLAWARPVNLLVRFGRFGCQPHARMGATAVFKWTFCPLASAPRPHGSDTGKPRAPRPSRFPGGAYVFEPVTLAWRQQASGDALGETRQRRRLLTLRPPRQRMFSQPSTRY